MATTTARKNQLVAGHVAQQAYDRCHPEDMSQAQLAEEVRRALDRFRRSSIGAGHIDNAAMAARGLACARELWDRGVQLQIDF
jgi:hypothetical protein